MFSRFTFTLIADDTLTKFLEELGRFSHQYCIKLIAKIFNCTCTRLVRGGHKQQMHGSTKKAAIYEMMITCGLMAMFVIRLDFNLLRCLHNVLTTLIYVKHTLFFIVGIIGPVSTICVPSCDVKYS